MIGAAAVAMIACCGLPVLIAPASSVAIGTLLGVVAESSSPLRS